MKRFVGIALALALLASAAAAAPAQAQAKPVIRMGYVCGGMNAMVAQLGLNDGAYEKAGIDVQKTCFSAGAAAVQALIGGSIDMFPGSAEHSLRAQSRGINVKIYGCLQNSIGYSLITKTDSKYKTLADLKGQTVAVTAPKSLSDTGLRRGLDAAGINGDRDLSIISAGSGATMLAALDTDRAVAGMVSEPELQRLVSSKKYRVLYTPDFEYAGIVVMARAEFVAANKAAMQTLFRVMNAEAASARNTPNVAAAAMNKEFPDIDAAVMLVAVKDQSKAVPAGFAVPVKGLQDVNDIEVRDKNIPAAIPFDQVVSTEFLAGLK
jgi:NitT/TauT family transport system substrate-binding protein